MKKNFEERRNKRIENAKRLSKKNEQEAESLYSSAREMASAIPMGQPILVGHHSEKRDRRYRGRIDNTFAKSFEKMEKAKHYADKAETIEVNDSIFSDDPDAIEKLNKKLKALQTLQEFMKSANKYVRKNDETGFLQLPNATPQLWAELNTRDCVHGKGYPSYRLTNNNANIKRTKDRIEQIKSLLSRPPLDRTINGVRIFENIEANRLQLLFEDKPTDEVRKLLKKSGFRWAPSEMAWQRHISNGAIYEAKRIANSLGTDKTQ